MFSVRDEGPLPGFKDLLPPLPKAGAMDAAYIEGVRRAVEAEGLPVRATMGPQDWGRQIERFLFRKLVRELPEQKVRVPWFECHVPPGGKLGVKMSGTREAGAGFSLKVYGAGLGAGRKVQMTMTATSDARRQCATFAVDVLVKPRIYDVRGIESLETEVLRQLGDVIETAAACPYCGVAVDGIPPDFTQGEYLDLRGDPVAAKRTLTFKQERWASFECAFKVPTLPVEAKLDTKVSFTSVLELETEFPPGALYQPYVRAHGGPPQTNMWAVGK